MVRRTHLNPCLCCPAVQCNSHPASHQDSPCCTVYTNLFGCRLWKSYICQQHNVPCPLPCELKDTACFGPRVIRHIGCTPSTNIPCPHLPQSTLFVFSMLGLPSFLCCFKIARLLVRFLRAKIFLLNLFATL